MPEKMTRRKLLRQGSEVIAAGGVATCAAALAGAVPASAAAVAPAAPKGVDYYEKLGRHSVYQCGRNLHDSQRIHHAR